MSVYLVSDLCAIYLSQNHLLSISTGKLQKQEPPANSPIKHMIADSIDHNSELNQIKY